MSLFSLAIQGRLDAFMRADARAMVKIHNIVVRAAGGRTRRAIQKQIRGVFDDKRFANAIRFKSDPARGYNEPATVRVYSKARYQGKGTRRTAFDLLEIYTRAETVQASGHTWLAIPTPNAPWRGGAGVGRGGAQRQASPRESGLALVFLQTKDPDKAVLVTKAMHGARATVMYVLLRQTQRQAVLTPDDFHARSLAQVPAHFARAWQREDDALAAKFGSVTVEG